MAISFAGEEAEAMSDINVTPLVDVMLVLLIIFIITTPQLSNDLEMNLPSPKKETDPWVPPEPLAMASYYNESQSEAAEPPLQEMIAAYQEADSFKFSRSANQLREKLRTLSPSIYPTESKLRLEYFYNHFEGFYRAIWFYGIAFLTLLIAHLRKRGRALRNFGVVIALVVVELLDVPVPADLDRAIF
jgi:hypothetical protein